MMLPWWLLALLSSVTVCFDIGLNRYFKKDAVPLLLWISVVQAAIFAPFLFQVELPLIFIFAAIISGAALGVMYTLILSASKTISGAVIAQVMALRIWVLFFVWSLIDYKNTGILIQDPRFYAILATLLFGTFSLYAMRKCTMSRKALTFLLPAVLVGSLSTLSLKSAIQITGDSSVSIVLAYACIAACAQVVLCACWLSYHKKLSSTWNPSFALPAFILEFSMSITMGLRFLSIMEAPNPAYIYMITVLSSLWLYMYGRMLKLDQNLNPWGGFGLVASAIMLIYLTA